MTSSTEDQPPPAKVPRGRNGGRKTNAETGRTPVHKRHNLGIRADLLDWIAEQAAETGRSRQAVLNAVIDRARTQSWIV